MYKKRDVVYEKKVLIKQFIKIELKARQQILLMSFIMLLLFFENDNGLFYFFFKFQVQFIRVPRKWSTIIDNR